MANPAWQVSGEYFETCSCDYVCPCVPSNLAAQPTRGSCTGAMAFRIDQGRDGDVTLDGLGFAIAFRTPGVMADGNWEVGLIVDERATPAQRDAITRIASGQGGGPMAALGPLIGSFRGVHSAPVRFEKQGLRRSVSVPGLLDQTVEGTPSPVKQGEPLWVDNTLHPANARLALGKATQSHLHVFGMDWDDTSGRNNGHFAAFSWRG
jgi:hypothetical protein